MRKSTSLIVAVCLLASFSSTSHAADTLADRDWSVSASPSLQSSPPTDDDIKKAISEALDSDWAMNPCNYVFADPPHDGKYRLIVAFDGSGYHTCNRVVVIDKKGSKLVAVNDWQTRLAQKITNITRDLNNDNHMEIIIPEPWSKYEVGRCMAMWQKVYKWQDGKFTDHSSDYPELYKARLKELEDSIPYLRDPGCEQMEKDKISRYLRISPTAGYAEAVAWMKDSQPFVRRRAAAVFADIKDEESRKNLASLTKDSDALVAETAKAYLESAEKH